MLFSLPLLTLSRDTMSSAEKHQPSEQEIIEASSALLAASPALGIAKVLAHLQREKQWALSERRLKAVLVAAGLRTTGAVSQKRATAQAHDVPLSKLDARLPIPAGVRAVYFDSVKGKGLVADRDFEEGEPIFTEDAFVAAPPAHALPAVERGELCTQCFAPLSGLLVVPCGKQGCQARFCNRLCQSRAQNTHHALLCPGQNSSIKVGLQHAVRLFVAAHKHHRIPSPSTATFPRRNGSPSPSLLDPPLASYSPIPRRPLRQTHRHSMRRLPTLMPLPPCQSWSVGGGIQAGTWSRVPFSRP